MSHWEAILFGLIQGITEYLPISSSAHLILLPKFLGTKDPGLAFDVFLHIGTLTATLVYFRKDWLTLNRKLFWLLVMGTLPALVVGALAHDFVETSLRGVTLLAITLSVGGVLLWAVDYFFPRNREFSSIGRKEAWGVGLGQCLALIPGMSRSGSTILVGRLFGLTREAAAKFSFLLSAPVTGAAIVYESRKFGTLMDSAEGVGSMALILAGFSAFISGVAAIGILMRVLKNQGYLIFAVYRVALGIVLLKFFT